MNMIHAILSALRWITTVITAPGIIVHEIAHRLACDLTRIPVYGIDYLAVLSDTNGSVLYKYTRNLRKTFFINSAPLIVNSILAMVFTLPFMASYTVFNNFYSLPILIKLSYVILAWLGFAIGFHATPSNHDIYNIVKVLKKPRKHVPLYITLSVDLLRIIAFLRLIGFDLVYAWGLSKLLPALLGG